MVKFKYKSLLFSLFILLTGLQVSTLQSRNITLEEAIRACLDSNRDIKVSIMEIQKAKAAVNEAYGYAMPSVDVSASFSHFIEKPQTPFPDFQALLKNATLYTLADTSIGLITPETRDSNLLPLGYALQSFSLSNNYEAKIQVSQVLFNSAVFNGIGSAQVYLDLSKSMLKSKISESVLSVEQAFYSALLAKRVLAIMQDSYDNLKTNVDNVETLYGQGMISEYDKLKAEVQLENFKPEVKNAENNYANAIEGLKVILSLDSKEDIDVEGEFQTGDLILPTKVETMNQAMESNLNIQTLKIKEQVDNAFIDLYKADYWPTIAAFGNYSFNGTSDNFDFLNYRSGIVGISFSMNLFNGFRTASKVEQQQTEVEKTNQQLMQLRENIKMAVKSNINSLEKSIETIKSSEKNVDLAKRAYELSELRFKEGTGTQLELQNSELDLRRANLNKLTAVYGYIIGKLTLDNILGKVNPDYLSKFHSLLK